MSTQPNPTGWIETVVTEYKITLCKAIVTVKSWNDYNVKNPDAPAKRFSCARCHTFWSSLPETEHVNVCMMDKHGNQCICDTCASEIDQSLIIK